MAECRAAGIESDRLRLVPWAVNVRPLAADEAERVRTRYGIVRPYVFFCGTIEPRKNLHRVLAAFRSLDRPDLELVIAGPQGWKDDIGAAVAGLAGRVRRLGAVPRVDLDALYAGAAAVVYPSLGEGFGLPVLEAMAQGAAVVTSAGTATEEVAGDAALLVDPLDVDSIAGALDQLLEDRGLAAKLGELARERAAGFTWARSAELAFAVYLEAAGEAP